VARPAEAVSGGARQRYYVERELSPRLITLTVDGTVAQARLLCLSSIEGEETTEGMKLGWD